jgi:hypothetical protein
MKKIASFIIFIVSIFSVYTLAADGAVTYLYQSNQLQMKRGRNLDKVWLGLAFNRKDGFIVSKVEYDVKVTNEVVIDYLPAAFSSIGNNSSSSNLVLNVVRFSEKVSSVFPYHSNRIRIEGRIFNKNKELVAVFQAERAFAASTRNTKFAIDDIVWAVKKDLC